MGGSVTSPPPPASPDLFSEVRSGRRGRWGATPQEAWASCDVLECQGGLLRRAQDLHRASCPSLPLPPAPTLLMHHDPFFP